MSRGSRAVAVSGLLVAAAALAWQLGPGAPPGLRVYTARSILTLDPERPRATAVAVEDGSIVAVGSRDEVVAGLGVRPHALDERFAEQVLLPGFIDPHIHPSLAATILPLDIVSSVAWDTPRGRTRPVRSAAEFAARLRDLDAERPAGEWLGVWGYHALHHGELSRAQLDAVSTERPIFVWQRSVHEAYFNTPALEQLGVSRADFEAHPQASWERGHLWEAGLLELGVELMRRIASPASYWRGLGMMLEMLHRGGLTTVGEQGFPQVSAWGEWLLLRAALAWHGAPQRFVLVPNAMFLLREHGSAEAAVAAAEKLLERSSERVRFVRHAKYYADGAMFSQLMQLSRPYLDGHHGEWMLSPETQASLLRAFWRSGWGIHVHVNGDAGVDVVLDQIEAQARAQADPGRRIVLEHYGYAREEQHARLAALGAEVSSNPHYVHELAPVYAQSGLGPERAAKLSPLGGLERAGVPTSYHSDYLMAPAEPLHLVWVAVNRVAVDGRVWGADERVSLDAALRAITLDAARSLGLEAEIGSIEPGKRADFTVLESDPYEVDPLELRDIPVWGTVQGGVPYPLKPR